MRRPLIGIALCYVAGTWLALTPALLPGRDLLLLLAFLLFVGLAVSRKDPGRRAAPAQKFLLFSNTLVLAAVLLAAWSMGEGRVKGPEMGLHGFAVEAHSQIRVKGVISGDPFLQRRQGKGFFSCSFPLDVTAVELGTEEYRFRSGRLLVTLYGRGPVENAMYGETWLVEGKLTAGGPEKETDRSWYLNGAARKAQQMRKASGWHRVVQKFYVARRRAREGLEKGIGEFADVLAILNAIILGYRQGLTKEMRNIFSMTGTLHIFAISGLHVGIIVLFAITVLKTFKIPRTRWVFFLGPVLVAYTLATGARASAVRACIMAVAYYLAPVVRRRADVFSTLALAALVILCVAPEQLVDAGFILSFVVVAGLLLLYPMISGRMRGWIKADEFLVQDKEEPKFFSKRWWRVRARGVALAVISLVAMSVSAWLVSAPLIACFFGSFSLVAPLSNLVVIPMAFLIVLTGSLSLVAGPIWSLLAEVFNHANVVLVKILLATMDGLSDIPFANIPVGEAWNVWWVFLWYGFLGMVVFCLETRRSRQNLWT